MYINLWNKKNKTKQKHEGQDPWQSFNSKAKGHKACVRMRPEQDNREAQHHYYNKYRRYQVTGNKFLSLRKRLTPTMRCKHKKKAEGWGWSKNIEEKHSGNTASKITLKETIATTKLKPNLKRLSRLTASHTIDLTEEACPFPRIPIICLSPYLCHTQWLVFN